MLTTLFTGRNLIKLETTESTNSYLIELASKQPLPEGTVVVSDFQTGGKGQSGASWSSEAGKNILVSILFQPQFLPVKKIFSLSKAVALAVQDTLDAYGIISKIKWPNDIYVGEKKISGLLIENAMRGIEVQQSIVGIGVNMNQEIFPANIPNPVSMKMITGNEFYIDECLFNLCNHLERRYLQLKGGRFNEIADEYLNSLYLLYRKNNYNQLTAMNSAGQKFSAQIINVEDDGAIVLIKEDGSLERFRFKEIAFL